MGDYISKARQSIDEAIDFFLKRINEISENGPYRKARRIPTTFPMLKLGNDEFYEYAYFERTLEWFVRDLLINTILHDLLTIHNIESMWPDNKNYVRYSTESIEDIFPFEFIFINNGKKTGVRYTGLCAGEAAELVGKYEIDEILQIKWNDEVTTRGCDQEEYDVITPAAFFEKFLSTEEYELFLSKVLPAIEAANAEIGFETIPRLSLRYLSNFKAEVDTFLANTAFEQMRFQVLPGSKERKPLASMTFSADDYKILNKNFQQNRLYKALLGTEGFAKCFITAEYQFQVFKQGHSFVVILDIVLWDFALIDLGLLSQEIDGVAFLQERITFVLLVAEDTLDGGDAPFFLATGCRDAVFGEGVGNAVVGHPWTSRRWRYSDVLADTRPFSRCRCRKWHRTTPRRQGRSTSFVDCYLPPPEHRGHVYNPPHGAFRRRGG